MGKRVLCLALALLLALSAIGALAADYTSAEVVKRVQQGLNDAGFDCGKPDGIAGNRTKAAITAYQQANGLEPTGVIDDALVASLGFTDLLPHSVGALAKPAEPEPAAESAPEAGNVEAEPVEEAQPAEAEPVIESQPEVEVIELDPNLELLPEIKVNGGGSVSDFTSGTFEEPEANAAGGLDLSVISDYPDVYTLDVDEDQGVAFIESTLTTQERSFVHKYESARLYSYTQFDVLVVNPGTPDAYPLLRLWITYSSDNGYINFESATIVVGEKSYTFQELGDYYQHSDGSYIQQGLIRFGSDNLDFLFDLEDLFEGMEDVVEATSGMTAKLILHGREDIEADLGQGFFLDYLLARSGFVDIGGVDYLNISAGNPMEIGNVG